MKTRVHIITLAVCAASAIGVPVAQAKLQAEQVSENGSFVLAQAHTSQSTLAAMRKAGTSYHATANAKSAQAELQSQLVSENGSFVLAQAHTSQSTLAAMRKAGTSYHATAKAQSSRSLPSHSYDKPIG